LVDCPSNADAFIALATRERCTASGGIMPHRDCRHLCGDAFPLAVLRDRCYVPLVNYLSLQSQTVKVVVHSTAGPNDHQVVTDGCWIT
jgi:hypothetical protein